MLEKEVVEQTKVCVCKANNISLLFVNSLLFFSAEGPI